MNRRPVFYFHFVSWACIQLGFHLCLTQPNVEIHVPFGFFRIGLEKIPNIGQYRLGLGITTFSNDRNWDIGFGLWTCNSTSWVWPKKENACQQQTTTMSLN